MTKGVPMTTPVRESHVWHGFADMSQVSRKEPLLLVRGEREYLFDADGKRYLDASAGLWNANIGHGRKEIAQAAFDQITQLEAYSTFGDFSNEPLEELAGRVAELAPFPGAKISFTNGGSDATETAIKLVRNYWGEVMRRPEKRIIVSRNFAYHGSHMGATALGGIELDREGYGTLITDTARIEWDDAEALEQVILAQGADRVAAFICEPVIAAGGALAPPAGYLERVAQICKLHDVLLICDEVVTGFGRVGDWFGASRFGIEPDMIISAKGITSGYAPLGALIVGPRVSTPYFDGTAGPWFHGYTSAGHAASAAVALANLDVIENEGLIENARKMEHRIPTLLREVSEHPAVESVRSGIGLMAAVWLSEAARQQVDNRAGKIVARMRELGVLTRSLVNGQIQFSPSLTANDDHVQEFSDALLTSLEETER